MAVQADMRMVARIIACAIPFSFEGSCTKLLRDSIQYSIFIQAKSHLALHETTIRVIMSKVDSNIKLQISNNAYLKMSLFKCAHHVRDRCEISTLK